MVITLLDDYPRSMGCPEQNFVAYTRQQRLDYFKRHVNHTDVYISVYKFTEITDDGKTKKSSAYIDKVFFDFDGETWIDDLITLNNWCTRLNILHRSQSSSITGGHLFIFLKPDTTYTKTTVKNFQLYIERTLNIKIDHSSVGDIARIFRYPNSYHFVKRNFCIPIIPDVLTDKDTALKWVSQHNQRQFHGDAWSGKNLLDITKFNGMESSAGIFPIIDVDITKISMNVNPYPNFDVSIFPKCFQTIFTNRILAEKLKFYVILFLKEQIYTAIPYDTNDIIRICRVIWSEEEFQHYFGDKPMRSHKGHSGTKMMSVLNRDYYFPDCDKMKKMGLCLLDCGRRNPIYP